MHISGKNFMLKLRLAGIGCSILVPTLSMAARDTEKPNIVFILADDLGYGDVSCLNRDSKISTPNIDRIAGQGITFTDAHSSSAVSTPTRYGILTGRYNWRSTLKQGVLDGYSKALIPDSRLTMASMLKDQGYQTGGMGKWHLGWTWGNIDKGEKNVDYSLAVKHGPVTIGFEYFFGISASLDMPPYVYLENDRVTGVPDHITEGNNIAVGKSGSDGSYWRKGPTGSDFKLTDCLPNVVSHAIKFIDEKAESEKPYFLYLALPAPHTPILPSKEFQGKSGLNPYADFVLMVDSKVGEVLDAIERSGEKDNTIVVFASDNGCSPWADFPFLNARGHDPSYIFRGTKADLFDGGHRIPCLMQWPDKIKKPFTINQTICLNDFMATFAAVTGYSLADNEAEDSYNLLPAILNPKYKNSIREALVSHSINGSFTIRQGEWKLLLAAGSGGWSAPLPGSEEEKGLPPVQLYNLKSDPEEILNLQYKYPETVKRLTLLLKKYIEDGRSTPGALQKNDGEYPWKQVVDILNN
jgi:arylsulfatase A